MTEDEVSIKCRDWILAQGLRYKGVLSKGQVRVPVENATILIDHQGEDIHSGKRIWIEAKGSGYPLSEYLEGFIRTSFAVYYGGGIGYLGAPSKEVDLLLDIQDFFKAVSIAVAGKGKMGIFDAQNERAIGF